jgi:hypothetical protein
VVAEDEDTGVVHLVEQVDGSTGTFQIAIWSRDSSASFATLRHRAIGDADHAAIHEHCYMLVYE